MIDNKRGPRDEPVQSVNPYESPQTIERRGPLLVRLARATRRAVAAYWTEIGRSNLTTVEHFGAWLALVFWGLIALGVFLTILALVVGQLVSEM